MHSLFYSSLFIKLEKIVFIEILFNRMLYRVIYWGLTIYENEENCHLQIDYNIGK